MKIDEYLTALRKKHNIAIGVDGDTLKVQANQSDLTNEIIAEIKGRKEEILKFFLDMTAKEKYSSIDRAIDKKYYELSPAQQRLYFIYEMHPFSTAYNMPQVILLEGHLDIQKFKSAFDKLIMHHEPLRTSFLVSKGQIVQKIHATASCIIAHFSAKQSEINATVQKFIKPFDLSHAPLLRVGLIQLAKDRHVLAVDVHHIITDGVTQEILLQDFLAFYGGAKLKPLSIQYKDYAEWTKMNNHVNIETQKEFWLKEFEELPPRMQLPTDKVKPAVRNYMGSTAGFTVSVEETKKLDILAKQQEVTPFMLILSIYNVFLKIISNSEDLVVGVPTAGRNRVETQHMVGLFLNNICIRNQPKSTYGFDEFLATVKAKTLNCFENQQYQFEELINDLGIERENGVNPLFEARFVFQNYDKSTLEIPGIKLSPVEITREVSQFNLTLYVEKKDQLHLNFNYSTELFEAHTIERFIGYLKKIISLVVEDATLTIGNLEVLSESEKKLLVNTFNNTSTIDGDRTSLLNVFEKQVKTRPDDVAVVCLDKNLTFKELDVRSNDLANEILKLEIRSAHIGLYTEPSLEMLIAIWAILKAGYAFLPIDPLQHTLRNQTILRDSKCDLIVTKENNKKSVLGVKNIVVNAQKEKTNTARPHAKNITKLAYIIYTSGSTGKPKGVKITKDNLTNYVCWFHKFFDITEKDSSILTSSFAFDLGYSSLFPTILKGATVHLVPHELYRSPLDLKSYIIANKIAYLKVTPSLFSTMVNIPGFIKDIAEVIRLIILGGEPIRLNDIETAMKITDGICFANHYGPTETTIGVLAEKIIDLETYRSRPTIGTPIDNTKVLILDENEKILPIGTVGELCVIGSSVGDGYLNTTKGDKFKSYTINGTINQLYKTGDMARWLSTAKIEFIGRIDDQIKINGYRVELKEIINVLTTDENISEATILVKKKQGHNYMVAYYVSSEPISKEALKNLLTKNFPAYMIPSEYLRLEQFPLTANGKIDKKSLPQPESIEKENLAPTTDTQRELVKIWSELLEINEEEIGVDDNFFDLGGNSIAAIKMNYRIRTKFSVSLEFRELFENTTIEKIAVLITTSVKNEKDVIKRIPNSDQYIASSAQRRLYYEYLKNPSSTHYNILNVFKITGEIDSDIVHQALEKLVERHETLRTSFTLDDEGEVVQSIKDNTDFELYLWKGNSFNSLEMAIDDINRPFDLSEPNLLRCGLFEESKKDVYLIMCMHHIICDGISKNIMIREFKELYNNNGLPAMALRYVDYAHWQRNSKENILPQKEYWSENLQGIRTEINLPRIKGRELAQSDLASYETMFLEDKLYHTIKQKALENQVSDFMFLLSIYYLFLAKISGEFDIVIGTDVGGRTHSELGTIVGTFVNLLPLRLQFEDKWTFSDLLSEVKQCAVGGFENQDYQYDQMCQLIKEQENITGDLFQVHFTLVNYVDDNVWLNDSKYQSVEIKWAQTTLYELKIHAIDEGDRFRLLFIYNKELYNKEIITLFKHYYKNILHLVLDNGLIEIGNIEIEDKVIS